MTIERNWFRYPLQDASSGRKALLDNIINLKDECFSSEEALVIVRDYNKHSTILERAEAVMREGDILVDGIELALVRSLCKVGEDTLKYKLYRELLDASTPDNWLVAFLEKPARDSFFDISIDNAKLVGEFFVGINRASVHNLKHGEYVEIDFEQADQEKPNKNSSGISPKQTAFLYALNSVLKSGGCEVACNFTGRVHDARFFVEDLLSEKHSERLSLHVAAEQSSRAVDRQHDARVSAIKLENFNKLLKGAIDSIAHAPQPFYRSIFDLIPMYNRLQRENGRTHESLSSKVACTFEEFKRENGYLDGKLESAYRKYESAQAQQFDMSERTFAVHVLNVYQVNGKNVSKRLPETIEQFKRSAEDFALDIKKQACRDDSVQRQLLNLLEYERYIVHILEKHIKFLLKYFSS